MEVDTRKEKEDTDPTGKDVKLSFLHTIKLKANSSLQTDSWMYNELMTLKKRMGKMQEDQETYWAKIIQLEVQVGNMLEKLQEYEQEIHLLIRESVNKMEQATSNLYTIGTNLGKKNMMKSCHLVVLLWGVLLG